MSKYSEQVRKDAKAAADYIREHGWCQGTFVNKNGCVCAGGAINRACIRDSHLLYDAFDSEIGTTNTFGWNDTPGRTKEEVLAVFDKIASE